MVCSVSYSKHFEGMAKWSARFLLCLWDRSIGKSIYDSFCEVSVVEHIFTIVIVILLVGQPEWICAETVSVKS